MGKTLPLSKNEMFIDHKMGTENKILSAKSIEQHYENEIQLVKQIQLQPRAKCIADLMKQIKDLEK